MSNTDDPRINPLTGRPISAADVFNDPEFKAFAARVTGELVPELRNASIAMTLVPTGEIDVHFAVQLGLSLMLDKPLLVVAERGKPLPRKLELVADEIVWAPRGGKSDARSQSETMAAVERLRRLI